MYHPDDRSFCGAFLLCNFNADYIPVFIFIILKFDRETKFYLYHDHQFMKHIEFRD